MLEELDQMTDQLRQTLQMNYDHAKKSGDANRIMDAQEAMHWAELECQAHTSERVKRIERDVIDIKTQIQDLRHDISSIKDHHEDVTKKLEETTDSVKALKEELSSLKDKGKGAYFIVRLIYCFLAGGGAVTAVKLFKLFGWI